MPVKTVNRRSGSKPASKRTVKAASKPATRAKSKTSTATWGPASPSAWGPALAGFKKSAARRTPGRRQWPIEPRTMVYGAVGIIATAALIAALQSPGEARIAQADDSSEVARVESVRTSASGSRPGARSLAEPVDEPSRLAAAESESTTGPTPVSTNGEGEGEVATISGCLATSDDTFWLRDTTGADAPKARSWKSGFLKKRPSSIELVDGVTTRRLAAHVGQRIETTGLLLDREMRVKSLRVLGSCE